MAPQSVAYIVVFCAVLTALAYPIGLYMAAVFEGRSNVLSPVVRPVERGVYRLAGIDETSDQDWKQYGIAFLALNAAGFLLLYLLLRFQGSLPLNPAGIPDMSPHLAFNSAISFVTNTNWQSYSGEASASYLSQLAGFTFQNFVSAAVGMAVLAAVVRGLVRHSTTGLGNFWVDTTRSVVYVLLPLSLIVAVFLVSQGVVQTFDDTKTVTTLEGAEQTISVGPAASQVAIKQLGTNGGGFFGTNSAHPLENPTAWSNFVQLVSILLIPAGLVFTFGKMAGRMRHAIVIYAVMSTLLVASTVVATYAEQRGTDLLAESGVEQDAGSGQSGGNLEGKEQRFGIGPSTTWAAATTAASNGSVNSMHDSYTPIGGLVPLGLMATNEVVFGGVGSGLYGMIMYVLLAVFIAGLMVGRTPEYLGKKVEAREMKAVMVAFLGFSLVLLGSVAVAAGTSEGTAYLNNSGPHGFSEILYNLSSGAANNGSAFAGMVANNAFYNTTIGLGMFVGRYLFVTAALVIAGSMAEKKMVAQSSGTFPIDGVLFGTMLAMVILVIGLLTYFPAFALGPIVEQLAMNEGSLS